MATDPPDMSPHGGAGRVAKRRRRRWVLPTCLFAMALASAACTESNSSGGSPSQDEGAPATGTASVQMPLRVMEFNVEYGGTEVDFAGVPTAIEAADADIVAVEEAYANMPRIADSVGWRYYDAATQVMSRFPVLTPPEAEGRYTFVEVSPGQVVAVANVHLPSSRYGQFQIARHGANEKEALAIEKQVRLPPLQAQLEAVTGLADDDIPVFLTGDFNAPSHLDWTDDAVGARDHVTFPVAWPVSRAVEDADLVDSYREVHPDPVADQGLTWPAARPLVKGYNPGRNGAPADRIDFIYSGGPATPIDSVLIGEEGGEGVDIVTSPWPTDHRALVSEFEVTPAVAPTFVALEQPLVDAGTDVNVWFHTPGDDGERVEIAAAEGGVASGAAEPVAQMPTGDGSPTSGTLLFPTEGWKPGEYLAALIGGSGEELSRTAFWVRAEGSGPQVRTTKPDYRVEEPIRVEWADAPGNRWDWVGLYKRGANPNVAWYLMWQYTEATVEGSVVFDDETKGWPLDPGRYSVYLLQDDSYEKIAGGNFTVGE